MIEDRRGLQGIRTIGGIVDRRRVRTPAGSLLELSALANEKQLLRRELTRWTRRHAEIERRLKEIGVKEERLLAIARADSVGSADDPAARPDLPTIATTGRVRIQELTY